MGLISLLFKDPFMFLLIAIPLLYSIIAHEVAHGWVAHLFGDDTAKRYGRLTLNPASHLDPIGTAMLFFAGFGWAKPVPVNYAALKDSRIALIAVSLAGCLTNILLAIVALLVMRFMTVNVNPQIAEALIIVAKINIMLGAFNLIPIPPLDGSKIVMAFLPQDMQESLARVEPYGFFILIILIVTGLLNPLINFMQNAIMGLIGLLFGMV